MKVLTHEGALVTLPFSLQGLKDSEFERIDGQGGSEVGIVAEMSESAIRSLVNAAGEIENNYMTPRSIMNDIRFIARSLLSVADGAEIRMHKRGDRISLEIPHDARPAKATVTVGARVAFNGRVRPKAAVNARGTVESIRGDKATVKLDAGDRQRLTEATGNDYREAMPVSLAILDVLDGEQS